MSNICLCFILGFENNENTPIWQAHKKPTLRDNEATLLMLKLRGREDYKKWFSDKKHNKTMLWTQIGEYLIENGYMISGNKSDVAEKCRQKFANLQRTYMQFVDNMKKTGTENIPKPPFFEEMDEILGKKDKVSPQYLIDSSAASSSSEPQNISNKQEEKTYENKNTVKPIKNQMVEVVKNFQESQRKQIDSFISVIKENMLKQNEIMDKQLKQRGELIEIFKHLCKNKKRKRSTTSDSE